MQNDEGRIVDLYLPRREDTYGPGLAFRVVLHNAVGPSTLIGEGGRIDQLLARFHDVHGVLEADSIQGLAESHNAQMLSGCCGISMELAVDKLTAALVEAARDAHGSTWRGAAASGKAPWWRELPGCWPLVLVGAVARDGCLEAVESFRAQGLFEEVLALSSGLWRLGARCEVHATPIDAAGVTQIQHGTSEGSFRPDFLLLVQQHGGRQDASGSGVASHGRDREDHMNFGGESGASAFSFAPGKRNGAASAEVSGKASASPAVDERRSLSPTSSRIVYEVRAVSDQAIEAMQRAKKDHAPVDFDERRKVYEFFEKLARRAVHRPLGQLIPRGALEALMQ
eukprot:TRINITY_DN65841_c0_g1_i2.p1 TRINITY_DN65841_c0_g1~~TRINITY_DN65841_c0_g1_i2.p1  ORF type:complete len:340 (-),score=30.10 TRINITY_DN65841_c0_g1_i2:175-1194(-)